MDTSLEQWPALVVTSGPQSGRSFTLVAAQAVIGRGAEADIGLDSPMVSRRHALVRREGSDVVLEDLGSANGSKVNDRPLSRPVTLKPGDLLQVGDVELRFGILGLPAQRAAPAPSYGFGDVAGPVNAGSGALNVGGGWQYVAGGNIHHGDNYDVEISNDYDPWDEMFQGTGPGRVLMVLGGLLALAGFLTVGAMIVLFIGEIPQAGPESVPQTPFTVTVGGIPVIALGFVAFLGGGILAGVGSGMSRAARKRTARRRR